MNSLNTNTLLLKSNVLLCIDGIIPEILHNFCGTIITNTHDYDEFFTNNLNNNFITYICGDIGSNCEYIKQIVFNPKRYYLIKNLTTIPTDIINLLDVSDFKLISIGEVPINIENIGVYFRKFFDDENDFFESINSEHWFQKITESNKSSDAYRTGIYLTNVYEEDENVYFKLLRCSSNLNGPTENLKKIDRLILKKINDITPFYFLNCSEVNHVLAQTYHNTLVNNTEKKAKIKEHSDKTKDMNPNGLMAFCTFYENIDIDRTKTFNSYDKKYGDSSIYTKIRWRLKEDVLNQENYKKVFDVILYPNSVFVIPLITNRYYTHEIIPSCLPIDKIPTRLGYVVRSSDTQARYNINENKMYIHNKYNNAWSELVNATDDDIKKLKDLYFKENTTSDIIDYGFMNFSLNNGDYLKPI